VISVSWQMVTPHPAMVGHKRTGRKSAGNFRSVGIL